MGNMDPILFPEQEHPLFKLTSFFAKTDSVDAHIRSMVLVFLCFLVAFGKFISLVQVISLKTPTMVSIAVFCFWMQMLCIPFYLKRSKNLYLLSHYTLGMLYIGVLFSTYSASGYNIVNCTIFPILPLVATFLFNTFWDVIGWWSLLLLTNIGFYMYKTDWEPGDFPSTAQLRDFTFLANMLCMSISAILGGVFNFSSNIKQRELEHERDKAQDLSKLKSEFTANVSHEIRTPLVAVIGLSELLAKDTMLSSDQRYLINTIYSASLHLDNLVNNVLNFSKTEANMIELENTPFDVTDLVEETLLYFSAMAESCNIHLLSFIDPMSTDGFSNVTGDPHRIQQILQNLVANAIKFCSESSTGEVIITLDSIPSKEDENGRLYRFAVADNGIGMSKAGIQKLFLPFSQCDSSTTRRYGGTGLGLVICKQLCTLLGGDIEVDSEIGKGTTITFTLPLLLATSDSSDSSDIHPHPKKVRKMQTAAAAEAAANAAAKAADNAETAEAEANFAAKAGLESQTKPTDEEVKAAKATQEAANETAKAARATANAAQTTANAVKATADAVANAEADYQALLASNPQPLPEPAPLPPEVGTLKDQHFRPLVDGEQKGKVKDQHSRRLVDEEQKGKGKEVPKKSEEEVRTLEMLDLDGISQEEEVFTQNKKSTLDDLDSLLNGKESPKDHLKSASTPRISKGATQNSPFSVLNRELGALSPPLEVTRNARSLSMGKLFSSPFSPPFRVMTAAEHPPKSPNSTAPSNTRPTESKRGFMKDKLLMSPDFHKILTKSQDFWHHSASIPGATPKNRCVTGYLDPIMGDAQTAWAKVRNSMNTSDTVCVLAESPGSREVLKSMLLFRGISNVEILDEEGYVNLIHQSTPPRYRVVIAEAEVFSHIGVNGLRERQKDSADIILDPAVFNPQVSGHYILLVSCKYHRFGKFLEFPVPPIEGMTTKEHVVKVVFCAENPVRRTSLAQSLLACVEEEKEATKNIAQGNKAQKASSPPQTTRSNLQILLCEDNLVNIEVLTRQLKRLGYTNLDVKHNGAEGLKAFQEKEYDIILMDCQMPILDGYETTKEIRKIEQERDTQKHVPIVALTASALPEERERGLKSGMDNYLSKPIQLAVLQNVLEGIQSLV